MAEFKLERFKYNWRGAWTTSATYKRDDVVRVNGKSYVCIVTHVASAAFRTDLTAILPGSSPPQPQPKWVVMTSGRSFVGDWTLGTDYNLGDVVMTMLPISNFDLRQDFSTAVTPWITSQRIGAVTKNLLRFHTISHGTSVNHEVKVGIRDIRTATEVSDPNGYGSFTVEVRRVNTLTPGIANSPYSSTDTDSVPDRVEQFLNVTLDPDSPRYVARVIGDRYQTINDSGDIVTSGD